MKSGNQPSPEQTLLLRASLLDGDDATEAWQEWRGDVNLDELPVETFVVLPLLYKNLVRSGCTDSEMPRLKAWYTRTWFANETQLRKAAGHLSMLQEAGIKTILLKGAAMTLAYYQDPGLRPMSDIDVLIRPIQAVEAATLFEQSGLPPTPFPSEDIVRYTHSTHFSESNGFTIDLHWRMLWEFGPFDEADTFWDESVRTELHGVPTQVLSPTDQLFHVFVHGSRWHSAPLRWIPDAITLLSAHGSEIDFDRLLHAAARHQLVLPFQRTMGYLGETWPSVIPEDALSELQSLKLSKLERLQNRHEPQDDTHSIFGKLPKVLARFLRITRGAGFARRLLELPRFLVFDWKLEHVGQLPQRVVSRTARRVGMAVRRNQL